MKKFEITKEQILLLAEQHSWSESKLKEWFPEAFQSELEVGRWYKNNDSGWRKSIAFVVNLTPDDFNDFNGYGFDMNGDWLDCQDGWGSNDWTLATDKEVETALIAEAKRRGFKDGVKFKNMREGVIQTVKSNIYLETGYTLHVKSPKEEWEEGNSNPRIFDNGKWAEIISEPIEVTLEEIAEKFNVNVEQLKIKK